MSTPLKWFKVWSHRSTHHELIHIPAFSSSVKVIQWKFIYTYPESERNKPDEDKVLDTQREPDARGRGLQAIFLNGGGYTNSSYENITQNEFLQLLFEFESTGECTKDPDFTFFTNTKKELSRFTDM